MFYEIIGRQFNINRGQAYRQFYEHNPINITKINRVANAKLNPHRLVISTHGWVRHLDIDGSMYVSDTQRELFRLFFGTEQKAEAVATQLMMLKAQLR